MLSKPEDRDPPLRRIWGEILTPRVHRQQSTDNSGPDTSPDYSIDLNHDIYSPFHVLDIKCVFFVKFPNQCMKEYGGNN